MVVTHKVDTFEALFHFIEMYVNIVTLFSSESIEVSYIDDKGLVPIVVIHIFKIVPYVEGCFALVHIDHLSIYNVALYLHTCEGII